MRPHRPGLSIRPLTRQYRPPHVTDGSEEDSLCSSQDDLDHSDDTYHTVFDREPTPYGPSRPGTPSQSPSTPYTASTRPPSPAYPISSSGTPISSPNSGSMNGFGPYQSRYWPGGPPPPQNAQINPGIAGHPRPQTPYGQPPVRPVASMWAWAPPPNYLNLPNAPLSDPRRPGHHLPNQYADPWMRSPQPDPVRAFRPYRNSSPGPTLSIRRSQNPQRHRSLSETRAPKQQDPALLAALRAERHANKVLAERLKREEKEKAKREAREREAEAERGRKRDARLKELEEQVKRHQLYDHRTQMKQDIKNEIFAELQQGVQVPPPPITVAGQLGPSSGFSSEATPSSGTWAAPMRLTAGHHAPRMTGGGIPLGTVWMRPRTQDQPQSLDQQGYPPLEFYMTPPNTQDVWTRGRQPAPNIRYMT